jgi:Mycobacterium 19 kDa lipoprotein antigen
MTAVVAALAVTALSGCSGTPSAAQIASTGSVNINGNDVKTPIIRCYQQDWFRTIELGDSVSGATIVLDGRTESLTAESVRIQNLGGFTGMYSRHDDAKADTILNGGAYTVKGTAEGHKADKSGEPASADFRITVRC